MGLAFGTAAHSLSLSGQGALGPLLPGQSSPSDLRKSRAGCFSPRNIQRLACGARCKEVRLDLLGESVCPYCGVGCRLKFEGANGEVQRVRGVEKAPANLGGLCAKAPSLARPSAATIASPSRNCDSAAMTRFRK